MRMRICFFSFIFISFTIPINMITAFCEDNLSKEQNKSLVIYNQGKTGFFSVQTLFKRKRVEQIGAVKRILNFKYEEKFKILSAILEKIFEAVAANKALIENSDYIPGDFLSSNDSVNDALYQLLDNTAMYGELQLKLPDIIDRIMKQQSYWIVLIKWSIGFTNATNLFDGKTVELINLVAQDMSLIEQSSTFINPYRLQNNVVSKDFESDSQQQKKKKFKDTKGPRISKPSHIEF